MRARLKDAKKRITKLKRRDCHFVIKDDTSGEVYIWEGDEQPRAEALISHDTLNKWDKAGDYIVFIDYYSSSLPLDLS